MTIFVAHEIHWDLFGLSLNSPTAMRNNADQAVRSKDKATAVAFEFKFGGHQFSIEGNEKKYDETGTGVTGRVRSYKNNGYLFAWDARWSPSWRTAVQYIRATKGNCTRVNAVCNTDGLKGEQFGVGVAYYLSRRTYLFLMGTYVKNDFSAIYNNSNLQAPNPGEDITLVGVGIHTSF
jgi:predicted porin